MRYRYLAYNMEEGIVKGRLDARAVGEAHTQVASQGYKPLTVVPLRQRNVALTLFPSLYRVKTAELVHFCRNMATMLTSGGNLVRVLDMMQRESRTTLMRRTMEDIRRTLDQGGSFSEALAAHPIVFNPLFISIVEVGEHTGRLGPALEEMADILQQEEEAKQKAVRTLMYPLAIIGLAVVTVVILMLFALPPMLKVFERMGDELPLVTRITLAMFNGIQDHFLEMTLGTLAFVVMVSLLRRITGVRYWMDLARTRLPLLGGLVIAKEMSRFASTVSLLLGSGVALADALKLGLSGCRHLPLKRAFQEAEESLLSGHGLAEALKRHPVIPTLFVELVVIGEESNTLARTMNDAATAYQKHLDQRLNSLLGMLEPVSTLIVGGIVALIAFSMFVPIYASMDSFK
ncbi:MAG: type II secretion system F family protein [Chloroflexi bacterium]|nr:type II secretion system F family protein [Chloroflexota bacterium]